MDKRKALRNSFDLQEDCNDCVATTFCAPCAICQEARELKTRLVSSQGICTSIIKYIVDYLFLGPILAQPIGTKYS